MAIVLVTYDLQTVGQNYQRVHDYLKNFQFCKHLEHVWLLDTTASVADIRDQLRQLVDPNDIVFVAQLQQNWGSLNFPSAWLSSPDRSW